MKSRSKKIIITLSITLAVLTPVVIFNIRAPVLIVTEQAFIELYGKKRLQKEAFYSSVALFRPVKTVTLANDAGDDVVPFAVAEVSVKPYCVLFPLRFVKTVQLYKDLNPQIPVVVLEGRYPENDNPAERTLGANKTDFFIYKTNISDDFYRLGLVISTLKPVIVPKKDDSAPETEENRKIAVFFDYNMSQMKDIFLKGLYDSGNLYETRFYNYFSQNTNLSDLSCVILAGLGYEYLEKKTGAPVVCFTWIDPFLLPSDVVLVVNDSPWAQVKQAVKMVEAGEKTGFISSEFRILNSKKFDKGVISLIKKTRKNDKSGSE